MDEQISVSEDAVIENTQADAQRDDHTREVLADVAYKRLAIVNVAFVGAPNAGNGTWVLIDAGMVRKTIPQQLEKIRGQVGARRYDSGKFDLAAQLFEEMSISPDFPDFLTLRAYEFLD